MTADALRGPSNKRLIADPCISVADLEGAIEEFLRGRGGPGDKNLEKFIGADKPLLNWKGAPDCPTMAKYAPLILPLAKVAPNGVLSSKKMKVALSKIHEVSPLCHRVNDSGAFFDKVDLIIRGMFAMFREMKKPAICERALKKAGVFFVSLLRMFFKTPSFNRPAFARPPSASRPPSRRSSTASTSHSQETAWRGPTAQAWATTLRGARGWRPPSASLPWPS